jgi:SNF2 family DNA or RNA helicase
VADQMGLGKTMQMIALIASDFESSVADCVTSQSSFGRSITS